MRSRFYLTQLVKFLAIKIRDMRFKSPYTNKTNWCFSLVIESNHHEVGTINIDFVILSSICIKELTFLALLPSFS